MSHTTIRFFGSKEEPPMNVSKSHVSKDTPREFIVLVINDVTMHFTPKQFQYLKDLLDYNAAAISEADHFIAFEDGSVQNYVIP